MKEEFTFYVGVDWGVEFHQACILDAHGEKICQRRIEHSGPGMLEFCDFLQALTNGEASALAVAIEVPRGPIVEALLEHNYAVFSINPKQLDRFRDRHTVAGAKDDRRDALVAADSLRTDQHCFRRVRPEHPDVIRLRELSRTEETLGIDLRRCVNQLSQLLLRYFPQLLRLCSTPDEPWLWALLELAPTPQQAAKLTEKRLKQLLAKYRIRRWTAEKVGEILTAPHCPWRPGAQKQSANMHFCSCRNYACFTCSASKSLIGPSSSWIRWQPRPMTSRCRKNIVTSQCCSLCLVLDASSQRPCWPKDPISSPSGIITP
jgi:hypothetical protein